MTNNLATCFGMFASLMRASISAENMALLAAEFPDYLWLTIKDPTMQVQEWLKCATNDEWCDILNGMSHYLRSDNAKEKCDKLINDDPHNFRRNSPKPPSGCTTGQPCAQHGPPFNKSCHQISSMANDRNKPCLINH